MDKIVVISDIHGSFAAWEKAKKYFGGADLVICAGDILYHGARNPLTEGYDTKSLVEKINNCDINLLMVKGNVDALVDDWVLPYPLPQYTLIDREGRRIIVYHGYQHVNNEERINFAERFGADILIYGHTHIPHLEKKDGIFLLNPGSLALPKQEPPEATLAIIEEKIIKIITLKDGKELERLTFI